MLIFSVSLSSNQLRVLAHIKRHIDVMGSMDRTTRAPNDEQFRLLGKTPTHFINGIDKLIREGFVEFLNPGYKLTEKGELVLRMAKMEAEKFISDLSLPNMKVAK